ncbi:isoquinoline 1-oxidoreductase, beta subunit [Aliiroseovarius halocynthiae]|uniref:Xanthine dehydrogenase family protein molybdopterin-binding subunit n=1 Tax=Aliiroseovarius halocynthiae TaxID=985055 RepID=A0A545SR88_9RHOB|nr:molybdopterin cofactor-binding domain-containing protein [Aliiroseovarius halocynthiae]TQV67474.1 xanthine dehydrogenase family protein molybdopterin-binding subunit [Aliiroseovarius halocynthiae]SMR81482.1 isoquinoline 1-oxidoreductase, beta subunit [Aliiroseovarius halocynthiae]
MGRIGTIARRTFLVGSAAILGGVAFGYYKYKQPVDNPLDDDLAQGEAALTPYVLINADGVTLITPRADKGQGAYSVQAALIAEELDIELDQINVDPGPPSAAYWNTAIAGEGVPFPSTDRGAVAEGMRGFMGAVVKLMGMQITGGSTTVPDGFEKLRAAGAVARETLKAAAADMSGLAVTQLKTERGAVVLPDGKRIPYQALAAKAAEIAPVTDVTLRPSTQWRLVGKPMQRVDMVAKSTGTQSYGIDMRMDGMVHAAVRVNPRKGGEMISFDASEVETMRGVQKVIPVTGGVGVIADNTWRAFQAVDAIEVEWDSAPYPAEQDQHWQVLADTIDTGDADATPRDDGDLDGADATVEVEYRAPYLAHAPLEPMNATVLVTDSRVDVWTGNQIPRMTQASVAKMTGMDADDVHVHILMMGGSFGHRLEDEVVKRATELAMAMKGTPVKLTYKREEDTLQDFTRPIAMMRGRGAVADGKVTAMEIKVASPSVMDSQMVERQGFPVPGPDTTITQALWDQPYAIPNYRVTGYRAPQLGPVSSWRSVGASQNGFFHENFLNALIHEAGADPVEERLRLMTDDPSRKTLEAVAEMSGWGGDLAANKARGVAFCLSFGTPCAQIIEITNGEDGIKLDKVWVAAEVGKVVDPVNFENLVAGGVIWGLGHAINSQITYADGMAEQENFFDFEGLRNNQAPEIFVRGMENRDYVTGVGEPPVPPAAPALAEAIFRATGERPTQMPFGESFDFA